MSAKPPAPIIIRKRRRDPEGAAHGGAWKIAYADFVTAMMAFFLVMWLLNATTEKQRKGLADYFNPSVSAARISGGGEDILSGDTIFAEDTLAHHGVGGSLGDRSTQREVSAAGEEASSADDFRHIEQLLSANSGESMASDRALRHIVTRVTDEGLIVELFDLPDEPLFEPESANPTEVTRELAAVLARVFAMVGNRVAVTGHVRSYPVVLAQQPVWPLSMQRATRLRELVEEGGLAPRRFVRVTGKADREQITTNPAAVRNNRLEIVLLRPLRV